MRNPPPVESDSAEYDTLRLAAEVLFLGRRSKRWLCLAAGSVDALSGGLEVVYQNDPGKRKYGRRNTGTIRNM